MRQSLFAKLATFALLIVVSTSFLPTVGQAQDALEERALKASNELKLLTNFQTFERVVSGMDRFLTYGIVSSNGGWGVLEFVDSTSFATNSSVLNKSASDYKLEVVRANAAIQRNKFTTEDEKRAAEEILAGLNSLFDVVPTMADALKVPDIELAGQIYRDRGQIAYQDTLRRSQSAIIGIRSRLQKTIRSQGAAPKQSTAETKPATDRALILEQHRLLKKYIGFERETRHFHYVLVTALLSTSGGWRNLPDDYNATQAGLIDGVIDKMAPGVNRLKSRAASLSGIPEKDADRLIGSAGQFQELFAIGIKIRDLIYADKNDEANLLYADAALPLFESIWASNYTLIAEAEGRIPAR